VRGWTDPADIRYYSRHFFRRSAEAEAFKTPQFDYLPISILNLTVIIKEDIYLAVSL
jgi:hypothetical protein